MKNWPVHKIAAVGLTASFIVMNGGCGGGNSNNIPKNYNVMLIVTDQEHYFSQYPQNSNYKARKLLAEMGTTFEKHYVCSNMSTSSRSTIFTGHHVQDTGMTDNTDFPWQNPMSSSLRTIGDIMNDAGYYSAIKGKWHLGDSSIEGGTSNITDLTDYGFRDWGGTDYIGSVWQGHEKDPVVVSEAVEWLGDKGKNLNSEGKPFFLLLTMINPHDIMDYDITGYKSPKLHLGGRPSDSIYDVSYDVPVPSTYNFDLTADDVPQGIKLYNNNWGILAGSFDVSDTETTGKSLPELWKDYQNYYFNCIQDSDNNLQKVIDTLRENDMLKNTIIIFTADHGEMHGSHGLKGKGGFVYENNIHVPLIIVHPDYNGGQKISALTSHIDLAATLADIAKISEDIPGKSLMPLIKGEKNSVRDTALFCYEMISMSVPIEVVSGEVSYTKGLSNMLQRPNQSMDRGIMRGIITEDGYKFARYFSPRQFNTPTTFDELFTSNDVQVFNMNADKDETDNLAGKSKREANRELIMRLNGLMNNTIAKEVTNESSEHILKPLLDYLSALHKVNV
ncbi:MAG: sulfatase-like hydrolase/transferase [Synergistaceae bacterium]|nr:sulfatase-like hydrolase/transferase [Synergistaceae bacterium]MBR0080855.1 sulfatase-like hydrolase/transferase [Synergistaceae bacterium]MBR0252266.1 sulfatase-like hydrolase/transferase [Synergistaceae bacterium]